MVKPRKCECCGKLFSPKFERIKYCSRACYYKAKRLNAQEVRYCDFCGASFVVAKHEKKRFCSRKCYYDSLKGENYKPKKEPENKPKPQKKPEIKPEPKPLYTKEQLSVKHLEGVPCFCCSVRVCKPSLCSILDEWLGV